MQESITAKPNHRHFGKGLRETPFQAAALKPGWPFISRLRLAVLIRYRSTGWRAREQVKAAGV